MPEVIFTGPSGRLEGRYQPAKKKNAPIAIVLHPHPQFGGTMNNQIVYNLFYDFVDRGFSVLRFNFRGVGRSQGNFDHGSGELSDAAAALDWAQTMNPDARACWIAGVSFGAWIGMQLLMRRPEIEGFILHRRHGQSLRLHLPRPLPVLRPVRARLRGPGLTGQGSDERDREGEDAEGNQDRAHRCRWGESLLRRQGGRPDDASRHLSRRPPRAQGPGVEGAGIR